MLKALFLIFLLILLGTVGFSLIEQMPPLDALYMTVITIFTVGFKEVKDPMSAAGKLFTIFIIIGGVGTVLYGFTKMSEAVYEGGVSTFLRRKKMEKELSRLKDHYIICGHGRIGRIVRERLEEEKTHFVILDSDPEVISDLRTAGTCLFLEGDATHEDVLLKAGIKKAKGLAALLPSDADNLYLVLTSKQINPSLFVLSKVMDEDAEKKILQIGANKVFSPYKISGLRIAQSLLRPTLVDFMDLVIRRQEILLNMEEFTLNKGCRLAGLSLKESDIRKHANVIVVAIKKPGKDILFNPSSGEKMESGDTLLVMGSEESIRIFEQYIKGSAA